MSNYQRNGDLQNANNWRGITLLSALCKVFCRVLLLRIEAAIDSKQRQEQAVFRKGRGCIEQIFELRNIIEQCLEWNKPLFINFIDFNKAFYSVHWATLWKILHPYGVPDWTTRKTTSDKPRGIQWNFFSYLEDLDFADDLAILSTNRSNLQEKIALLKTYAKQTGLHINTMAGLRTENESGSYP